MERNRDPYAPPPRHKDRSGAVLRVAIIAALLGLGVWGYTEFADTGGQGLTAESEQTTTMADASADRSYQVTPTPGAAAPAAEPATPAAPAPVQATPQPAPERSAPEPQPSEPVPPPSTTIGGTPGSM